MEKLKSKDFRIGNFITVAGIVKEVWTLMDDNTINDETNFYVQAIPLTEEWLLKLGFIENSSCFKKGILSFRYYKDIKFIPVIGDYVILNEIKYVHQVQNLVYSLSGEELKATL